MYNLVAFINTFAQDKLPRTIPISSPISAKSELV